MRISNDLLYYFHEHSGASDEKREGISIAIVSLLIDNGLNYHEALREFKSRIDLLFRAKKEKHQLRIILPEAWQEDFDNIKSRVETI